MFGNNLTRIKIVLLVLLLFVLSVAVRRPLFNKEFTASHEWLSAHALITIQLWNAVPENVHHFNLLYTFMSPADRFIDNLWNAGVPDASGRYYYVSMPHLAFLTPYLALKAFLLPPTLRSLQIFGLGVHLVAAVLLLFLLRSLTRGHRGSWLASIAGFCVLLFAPTALYFYQNAIVGTVIVIPYTITLLICVTALFGNETARTRASLAWLCLFISVLGGCLTDWQGYFTAFAAAVVASVVAFRDRPGLRTGAGIAAVCCLGVFAAILLTVARDAEIAGRQEFFRVILGRLKVRTGGEGQGITSLFYYKQLLRFYGSYAPFLILTAVLFTLTLRRGSRVLFGRAAIPLAISALAVFIDHIVLANHTSVHIFTTINSLPPIAILCAVALTAFLDSGTEARRAGIAIGAALALCVGLSTVEYWYAYRNRPHPFLAGAATIAAVAEPSDVIFAAGRDFKMPNDFIIPQMLYYLRRNVEIVDGEPQAYQYLASHPFRRGLLARFNKDFTVSGVTVLYKPSVPGAGFLPARQNLN